MEKKLKQIKMLLLDVDGVLTDGKVIYTDSGEEIKNFCSKDGFGLRLLMDSGIEVGIVTGRNSNGALNARCKNLGIELLLHGIKDKAEALKQIVENQQSKNQDIKNQQLKNQDIKNQDPKQKSQQEDNQQIENQELIQYSEIAFAGDDLPDIPAMTRCGFSFAVANAAPEVIQMADYTTKNRGGDGAVREICETILKAKGLWNNILKKWS